MIAEISIKLNKYSYFIENTERLRLWHLYCIIRQCDQASCTYSPINPREILMQINFETILKHAGEKLRRIDRHATSEERLVALKKFIKTETQRLYMRHRFGLSGELIASARLNTIRYTII